MTSTPAATAAPEGVWPNLTQTDEYVIALVNVGAFFFTWVLLRLIWPPPPPEVTAALKEVEVKINDLKQHYYESMSHDHREKLHASLKPSKSGKECLEGESAGDYNKPWTETFDLTFVILMLAFLLLLIIWTYCAQPELFTDAAFWLGQTPKVVCMMVVSLFGGLLCRYFCKVDEKGYIITNKESVFKVNYTRKLQHFAAYLVPLIFHTAGHSGGPLLLAWGNWFTMLSFLILIKPIRERSTFIMLQFNSLDRPEDRPNTLSWIVGGNILPGALMILFFRWAYSYTGQENMTYIFLFITGIGDGLAEPVGIYLGKHKYWVAGIGEERRYQRSLEGSACVFLSSILFVTIFYQTLANREQFWSAMIVLPPLMAYAEAMSPHTIDTPFLMGLGGLALWLISHISLEWM